MPSITLRGLRDTRRIKAWLRQGKIVEVRERDTVLGRIFPETASTRRNTKWRDFGATAREIFGDRILPGSELVIEERGRY
jgi:hypothetical protein